MDPAKFMVSNQEEESISKERVKLVSKSGFMMMERVQKTEHRSASSKMSAEQSERNNKK